MEPSDLRRVAQHQNHIELVLLGVVHGNGEIDDSQMQAIAVASMIPKMRRDRPARYIRSQVVKDIVKRVN